MGSGICIELADQKLKKGAFLNKKLFLSDANEGVSDSSTFHTNVLKLDAILKGKTLTGLHYQYNYYSHETHMTEPLPAYYDALRFIYKDWKGL